MESISVSNTSHGGGEGGGMSKRKEISVRIIAAGCDHDNQLISLWSGGELLKKPFCTSTMIEIKHFNISMSNKIAD
jgi:hypothetical protein